MNKHIKGMVLIGLLALLMVVALPAMAEAASAEAPTTFVVDLTPFIQVAITLLASLITIKVWPWIKARTTAEQQEALMAATKTIVFAAEQIYDGVGQGKQRLKYVQERLRAKGYTVDIDVIEAAVREMDRGLFTVGEAVLIENADEEPEPPGNPDNPAE